MNRRVTVVFIILLLPAIARAWGPDGHQIVGLIAEARLTDAARSAIRELLDQANLSDVDVAN